MQARDLLQTARKLARSRGKPRQSDLRRAISTTYYAAFHCLAQSCADYMVGTNAKTRSKHAWRQVYRALEHGFSRSACKDSLINDFPKEIRDFSNTFIEMQEKRHQADYDPYARFEKSEALQDILRVEAAIDAFRQAPLKDKRAFCAFVLFKKRP
ncbi:hypothetical protein [Amphiplicatus metriothermophilus]|uniref:Uncharacterized protein, contains HEPN domain, UPF0332 family n=1 Tax=Amphiplicatus metriothermophilus TaxID=1519374 RepID=A0A239PJU0_9PROT|nr:hypothetical protein [Amphiplicatus metriothermophilus]MBB5518073.1 uncharacterized protein (UPF0332 family) [Amphiplicatus metriothermophilus]SNT67593.1 Uncharacterized protein, contains HEPN domain, UPF0332 family [Amphiplicatus metriothermophilus]